MQAPGPKSSRENAPALNARRIARPRGGRSEGADGVETSSSGVAEENPLHRTANDRYRPQSYLKRFADMVSALENGRVGQDRPQWAQVGHQRRTPRMSAFGQLGPAEMSPPAPLSGHSGYEHSSSELSDLLNLDEAAPLGIGGRHRDPDPHLPIGARHLLIDFPADHCALAERGYLAVFQPYVEVDRTSFLNLKSSSTELLCVQVFMMLSFGLITVIEFGGGGFWGLTSKPTVTFSTTYFRPLCFENLSAIMLATCC